jgi:DNA repair exonuclease SbcCD nuclease subunit
MDVTELQARFFKVVTAAGDLFDPNPSPRNESLPQAYSEFQKCCQLLTMQIDNAERDIAQKALSSSQDGQPVGAAAQEVHAAATQLAQEIQGLSNGPEPVCKESFAAQRPCEHIEMNDVAHL